MTSYVIPIIFLTVLALAACRKKNAYSVFVDGSKTALSLMAEVFPYLLTVMAAVELMRASGVSTKISAFAAPFTEFFGIPKELTELMLVRPLSGAGAMAVLDGIYLGYGTDTYIGLCASIIYGSSETVFYLSSIYFSKSSVKNLRYAIPVALVATFLGCVLGCLLMKVMM